MGSGWSLVRRVQAGTTWHPATDHLQGTDVYGTFINDYAADSTFSIKFSGQDYNEVLFATGDLQVC
jgi:hypothetical protein